MELVAILLAAAIVLWLNIKASLAIARDDQLLGWQRTAQLAFVLALPLVGAVIVLGIKRSKASASRAHSE
jgi:hypothetical protein